MLLLLLAAVVRLDMAKMEDRVHRVVLCCCAGPAGASAYIGGSGRVAHEQRSTPTTS